VQLTGDANREDESAVQSHDGNLSFIESLTQEEAHRVLLTLLRAHPELSAEAETVAREQLTEVEPLDVADDIVANITALDMDDLNRKAGPSRYGYTSADEAAWELSTEPLAPWQAELDRLAALDRLDQAFLIVQGVLLGLYELQSLDFELKGWIEDFPEEQAKAWWELWQQKLPEATLPPSVIEELPLWRDFLEKP
jgi:hypothetical protein